MEIDYHFYIPFLLELPNHPLRCIKRWIKFLHKSLNVPQNIPYLSSSIFYLNRPLIAKFYSDHGLLHRGSAWGLSWKQHDSAGTGPSRGHWWESRLLLALRRRPLSLQGAVWLVSRFLYVLFCFLFRLLKLLRSYCICCGLSCLSGSTVHSWCSLCYQVVSILNTPSAMSRYRENFVRNTQCHCHARIYMRIVMCCMSLFS